MQASNGFSAQDNLFASICEANYRQNLTIESARDFGFDTSVSEQETIARLQYELRESKKSEDRLRKAYLSAQSLLIKSNEDLNRAEKEILNLQEDLFQVRNGSKDMENKLDNTFYELAFVVKESEMRAEAFFLLANVVCQGREDLVYNYAKNALEDRNFQFQQFNEAMLSLIADGRVDGYKESSQERKLTTTTTTTTTTTRRLRIGDSLSIEKNERIIVDAWKDISYEIGIREDRIDKNLVYDKDQIELIASVFSYIDRRDFDFVVNTLDNKIGKWCVAELCRIGYFGDFVNLLFRSKLDMFC